MEIGPVVVAACGISPGQRVLDVAAGTGRRTARPSTPTSTSLWLLGSDPTAEGEVMTTTSQMATFYNQKKAASELRRYREKGPIPSTKALIDALLAESVEGATVLDIGGGVGAIQHELLAAGAAHATSVDASAPYRGRSRGERAPRSRRSRHLSTRRLRRPGRLHPPCRHRDR